MCSCGGSRTIPDWAEWPAGRLPSHHADSFDRLLIAEARLESLTLVSRDSAFKNYSVQLLEE